ncbi:MAG: hypothetical protein FD181_652 [Prolixibacteraceae bacterium]|nr:MAG: hypothetical protein FD181_652 [Prolixibacteraceae bacterium]
MGTYIYKLIQEGEHQRQDFKYCINDSKKIAKSLVAFANTDGGRLLVGIKDNGKIVGIKTDEEYYMVEAAAKIYSNPPISFLTQQWQAEGKTVLEILIEPSTQKPHFAIDEDGKWLAYLRVGDENFLAHKIHLNVWKRNNNPVGVHFTYTNREKILIDYLQNNKQITISKFMRQAHISRMKAEEVITNFIIMNVINLKTEKEGTFFELIQTIDADELKKFK